jgi:hypothetical protein
MGVVIVPDPHGESSSNPCKILAWQVQAQEKQADCYQISEES